ncbi:MFS transporter [Bacillus sp. FSL W8-1127]|uniref:MFS transporter n=1 Tax=Bacillus TaxID=1386 RepID=UPI002E2205F6|nr:MFS transporter [Bacillus smithii]
MTNREKGFIYSCLLFTLISEMLLSPFYPQLFSDYFQVDGVQATSFFIICCRLVVIVMTPLWAMIWKLRDFQKCIPILLTAMGGCKILLPMGHTFLYFLIVSLILLCFQSGIYLLYPTLVAASKNEEEKVRATTTYLWIFHGSVVVSGMAGSFMVNQPFPFDSYYVFAFIDFVFAIASGFVFSRNEAMRKRGCVKKKENSVKRKSRRWSVEFLGYLLTVFLFYIGHNAIRPYFTVILDDRFGLTKQVSSLLYVLPSIVAIVLQFLLPKRCLKTHMKAIFISLTGITGGLLIIQSAARSIWLFVFIRILYGMCFFVSLAALDLLFFQMGIGKKAPLSYSIVSSMQNVSLLLSPMAALMMVQHNGLEAPFLLCGFLLLGSTLSIILSSIHMDPSSSNSMKRRVERRENL